MKNYINAYSASGLSLIILMVLLPFHKSDAKPIYVQNTNLRITLSANGRIKDVYFKRKHLDKKVLGYTKLKAYKTKGKVSHTDMENGGIEFKRQVGQEKGKHFAEVIERFYPTKSSIRWEVEIQGKGKPWSAPIETHFDYPASAKTARFWTAWGRPQVDSTQLPSGLKKALTPVSSGEPSWLGKKGNQWVDPLVPVPFSDALYYYGASPMSHAFDYYYRKSNIFAIPIATIIDQREDTGLNLVLSPADEIQDMTLQTGSDGSIVFSRLHNRISANHTVQFSLDLVAGKGGWRGGLAWMKKRYPNYFEPVNSGVFALAGTGAYSTHDANIDVKKFKKMDFATNWKASFDFPYMGMFLPPVSRHQPWYRFGGGTATIARMSEYAKKMKHEGFHVLNYFNVTEFGNAVHYPPQEQALQKVSWEDPNSFIFGKLERGIFYVPHGMRINGHVNHKKTLPIYSWYHTLVMDVGDSTYASFLLGQARRLVKDIPDASGICIDRLDHLRLMDENHDDGVTWYKGQPVRSLIYSWRRFMKRLSPIVHDAGQYIFVNDPLNRLDLIKHVDGIFNETGDGGIPLNTAALLGLDKPVIQWTRNRKMIKRAGGDAFFQKYLYMDSFPMAPFPGNDHSILPGKWVNQQYMDYGPLMKLMNNAKWVLKPHVISVKNRNAKANIFKVPQGYVVPVVYGGNASDVQVVLRGLKLIKDQTTIMAYYPGKKNPKRIKLESNSTNQSTLTVPLVRGCAMLLIKQ